MGGQTLSHPSLHRPLPARNNHLPAMSSREYSNMAHPNLDAWIASQQFKPTASSDPNSQHIPSPLGPAVFLSGSPSAKMSSTRQQQSFDMGQTQISRLYQVSQEHQKRRLQQNRGTVLQKAQEEQDLRKDWFIYRNKVFTLRECLLACALKSFCKLPDSCIGMDDDTITEVIQWQRGWLDSDGTDCRGLCAALICPRYEVNGRTIEHLLRVNRQQWTDNAWQAYWAWMNSMNELSARYAFW